MIMTKNQIAYHTLSEERRHNAAQEAIDKIAAEGRSKQGDAAKLTAEKKVNENLWKPLETISNNAAKILGGIL